MSPSRTLGRRLLGAALGAPVGAGLTWLAYSALFIDHDMLLPTPVPGERRGLLGRAGRLAYYVAGSGAPLLLIHSVNAAASSYEVRPVFEHYSASRRVYAFDLPGFGFSERGPRPYTPRLYADAILDIVDTIGRENGGAAPDALALSLGAEFLARAAAERPERFRSLALVTPTGFERGRRYDGPPGSTRAHPTLRRLFDFPLWGRAFFDLLNTHASQRYFLAQTFSSAAAVSASLLHYDYLTAHRPGAQHAPFTFISGGLFSADIGRVYEALALPVWLAYGTQGRFSRVEETGKVAGRPNWSLTAFDTGGLPFYERPGEFFAAYDGFLKAR